MAHCTVADCVSDINGSSASCNRKAVKEMGETKLPTFDTQQGEKRERDLPIEPFAARNRWVRYR